MTNNETLSAIDLAELFLSLAEYEEPLVARTALRLAPMLNRYRSHPEVEPVTRSGIREVLEQVGIDAVVSLKGGRLAAFVSDLRGYFVVDAGSDYPFLIHLSLRTRTGFWKASLNGMSEKWPASLKRQIKTYLTKARKAERK